MKVNALLWLLICHKYTFMRNNIDLQPELKYITKRTVFSLSTEESLVRFKKCFRKYFLNPIFHTTIKGRWCDNIKVNKMNEIT